MTDWQTMEAGVEFNRRIAGQLGITNAYNSYIMDHRHNLPHWGVDKNGEHVPILDYTASVDAALGLLSETIRLNLIYDYRSRGKWCAILQDRSTGEADTPALAICRAWMAYTDTKNTEADVLRTHEDAE